MSMNLAIPYFKGHLYQTTTEFSYKAIKLKDRYKILDLYYQEYVKPRYPKSLSEKDARNKYLVKERELAIKELEMHMEQIKSHFESNPGIGWIIR